MKHIASSITGLVIAFAWIAGIVLANGFWSTTIASFFPPWGLYLFVEQCLKALGWV